MAATAAVIASQAALDEGVLEGGRLEKLAAARGLRVRRAAGTPADLMVSNPGFTIPCLLWRSGSKGAEGSSSAAGGGGGGNVARIERLASMFKQACVLLPYELLGEATVLDAVSSLGLEESLSFVWMPMGASFTERALELALALLQAGAEKAAWRKQQAQVVTASEAVNQALLGLPLPRDGEELHHANMLRMLGSICDISQRRADEIAAHTDLDGRTAAAIAAFFQGPEPKQPPGLAVPAQLHSL